MKETDNRSPWYMYALMGVTAVLITIAGIYYKQSFLRILPLYFSLIVGFLQTRASRYSNLVGGLNSILYTVVFWHYRLYGSAAQSLLISVPFQLVTFVRWSRNAYGDSTVFRKLTAKQRVWVTAGFAVLCGAVFAILSAVGSQYRVLDTLVTLMGLLLPVLTLFACVEYSWLMLVSGLMVIALYAQMVPDYPEQVTYVIYAVYSQICVTKGFFHIRKLYAQQQAEIKEENAV